MRQQKKKKKNRDNVNRSVLVGVVTRLLWSLPEPGDECLNWAGASLSCVIRFTIAFAVIPCSAQCTLACVSIVANLIVLLCTFRKRFVWLFFHQHSFEAEDKFFLYWLYREHFSTEARKAQEPCGKNWHSDTSDSNRVRTNRQQEVLSEASFKARRRTESAHKNGIKLFN